jgi:hypothetical protein
VQSDPASRSDLKAFDKNPKEMWNQGVVLEASGAAKAGAKIGFAGGFVISGTENLVRYKRGEKTGGRAALDTAISSTKCSAECAVISAGAVIIKRTISCFERNSAPIVIAQMALETGKDCCRAIGGRITGRELLNRTGKNVVKNGTSWACAESGAVIGTVICPGIGTFIGGVSGGVAGFILGAHIAEKGPSVIKLQYQVLLARFGWAQEQAA